MLTFLIALKLLDVTSPGGGGGDTGLVDEGRVFVARLIERTIQPGGRTST